MANKLTSIAWEDYFGGMIKNAIKKKKGDKKAKKKKLDEIMKEINK